MMKKKNMVLALQQALDSVSKLSDDLDVPIVIIQYIMKEDSFRIDIHTTTE